MVALPKAVVAGIAGALAMECVAFALRLADWPAVDFVGGRPLAGTAPGAIAYGALTAPSASQFAGRFSTDTPGPD
jgi:hypothetical protein